MISSNALRHIHEILDIGNVAIDCNSTVGNDNYVHIWKSMEAVLCL